jgi:hypothetical protein
VYCRLGRNRKERNAALADGTVIRPSSPTMAISAFDLFTLAINVTEW